MNLPAVPAIFAIALSGYGAFRFFGWGGVAAGALVIVASVAAVVLYSAYADRRDWARAPGALKAARAAAVSGDDETLWSQLQRALVVPSVRSLTTEICQHNVEVLQTVIDLVGGESVDANVRVLRRVQAQFAEAQVAEKPEIKDDLVNFARDVIVNRGIVEIPR